MTFIDPDDALLSPLPRFAPGCSFPASRAWVDRLVLATRGISTELRTVDEMRACLQTARDQGQLITRFEGGNTQRGVPARIEFGSRRYVFGGGMKFRLSGHRSPFGADLELQLNPIRYRAHTWHRPWLGEVEGARGHLHINQRVRPGLYAYTLDTSDNILSDGLLRNPAFETGMDGLLSVYIDVTAAALSEELEAFGVRSRTAPYLIRGWTIRQIEIAWDFSHVDAIGALTRLIPRFRAVSGHTTVRYYPLGLAITVPTGTADRYLAVYTKARNRIRVEVRYTKDARRVLSQATVADYPNDSAEDVERLTLYARERASSVASRFIGQVFDIGPEPEEVGVADLVRLQDIVHRSCRSRMHARHVMSGLLENGRVVVDYYTPVREECDRLTEQRILRRSQAVQRERGSRTYEALKPYATLLRLIREALP